MNNHHSQQVKDIYSCPIFHSYVKVPHSIRHARRALASCRCGAPCRHGGASAPWRQLKMVQGTKKRVWVVNKCERLSYLFRLVLWFIYISHTILYTIDFYPRKLWILDVALYPVHWNPINGWKLLQTHIHHHPWRSDILTGAVHHVYMYSIYYI